VCSKHNAQGSTRRKERACACTAYLDLLDYDLDAARSLIGRGLLRDGFKVRRFQSCVWGRLDLICDAGFARDGCH
jgi:hypothetical protein